MDREKKCNQIIEQFYHEILRRCYAQLRDDPHGAEDCAHDVFLLLLKKQNELDLDANIRGWLHAATDRVVMDYRKKQKRIQKMLSYDMSRIEENTFDADELLSSSAFSCLNDPELQLLKDYYSVRKGDRMNLAKKFGLTVNELYKKVHFIRKKLRKYIK